jgi:hypothetical protein
MKVAIAGTDMGYRKKDIKRAMQGNMVWCRNGNYASHATPCQYVFCPFKDEEQRLAKPGELKRCNTFQITTPSANWATAARLPVDTKPRLKC